MERESEQVSSISFQLTNLYFPIALTIHRQVSALNKIYNYIHGADTCKYY